MAALPSLPPVRGERPFWVPAVTITIKTITSLVFQWRSLSPKAFSLAGEATVSDRVAGTQVLGKAGCHHRLSHLQCSWQSQNTERRWPHSAPELPSPNSPCLRCDFDPPTEKIPLLSLNLRAVLKGKTWQVYLAPSWLVLSNSAEEELYDVQQIPQWDTTNGKRSQNFS